MMSGMDFPDFAVACGEEGSDPLVLHERQVVRVDQYLQGGRVAGRIAVARDAPLVSGPFVGIDGIANFPQRGLFGWIRM